MTNNSKIQKTEKRLARPLKVLVPLIKEDLRSGKEAANEAGMPYYIAAGEKLIEAKASVEFGTWGSWLTQNFHLSKSQASVYMKVASKSRACAEFETLKEASGDTRQFHQPTWTEPVRDVLKRLKVESFNLRERDISQAHEQKLERDLGLKLIDIGYKVLAVKMHPDKTNGSADAMRRLNRVRARLKEAA